MTGPAVCFRLTPYHFLLQYPDGAVVPVTPAQVATGKALEW